MFIKHALLRKCVLSHDCPAEASIPFLASRCKHPYSCPCNCSQHTNKKGGGEEGEEGEEEEEEEEEEEQEEEEQEKGLLVLSQQSRHYRSARGYI